MQGGSAEKMLSGAHAIREWACASMQWKEGELGP